MSLGAEDEVRKYVEESARSVVRDLDVLIQHLAKMAQVHLGQDDADEAYAWLKARDEVMSYQRLLKGVMLNRQIPID